jgi:uncharacterized spore protein YtfJ
MATLQTRDVGTQTHFDSWFEKLAGRLGDSAQAVAVFGDAVERDGLTVIPVARARWGMGGGDRRSNGEDAGVGGGGGATVAPIGYIEIRGGSTRFVPIIDVKVMAGFGLTGLALLLFALTRRSR